MVGQGARPHAVLKSGGREIARARLARTAASRLLGWIGTVPRPQETLWIEPCAAVHTFGMRATIDVAFVGPDGTVLKVVRSMRPWRAALCWGAAAAVEFPEGGAADIRKGNVLELEFRCDSDGVESGIILA